MSDHQFINNYLQDFIELLQPNDESTDELVKVRNILLEVSSNNKKVLIDETLESGQKTPIDISFVKDVVYTAASTNKRKL